MHFKDGAASRRPIAHVDVPPSLRTSAWTMYRPSPVPGLSRSFHAQPDESLEDLVAHTTRHSASIIGTVVTTASSRPRRYPDFRWIAGVLHGVVQQIAKDHAQIHVRAETTRGPTPENRCSRAAVAKADFSLRNSAERRPRRSPPVRCVAPCVPNVRHPAGD